MNRTEIKLPKGLIDAVEKDIVDMGLRATRVKITPEISAFIEAYYDRLTSSGLRTLIKKHYGVDVARVTVQEHVQKLKGQRK